MTVASSFSLWPERRAACWGQVALAHPVSCGPRGGQLLAHGDRAGGLQGKRGTPSDRAGDISTGPEPD